MTFTTAAASEMRDRIGAVAGKEVAKDLEISTFHSFCLQLCRRHAEKCVAPFLIVEINAFVLRRMLSSILILRIVCLFPLSETGTLLSFSFP